MKRSSPFYRLVTELKARGKTCTVVETCCGGLINASIMSVPGSSSVYYGGSVAYNTKRAKKFLLNDGDLHQRLLNASHNSTRQAEAYIQSKMTWTEETAKAFCEQLDVDFVIAEAGASGPTFRPRDLHAGFAVVAVAGRNSTGTAEILAQSVVRSEHANRRENMRLFADYAAELAVETILGETSKIHQTENGAEAEAGLWLDRATHLRTDKEALRQLEEQSGAQCVVLLESRECLMTSHDSGTRYGIVLLPLNKLLLSLSNLPRSFLGLDPDKNPIFMVDVTRQQWDDYTASANIPEDAQFENTRTHAPLLPSHENELALYASALSNWKRTHKFCSVCGGPLEEIQGGTCLKCIKCSNMSWPRQDPSIIVLVTNRTGDKALMARSPRHADKVHTALAGFVEAGETFEQAVMREAFEETGIRVDPDSITYLSSQPWPFPRSCMVAFRATADDKNQEIVIDAEEIVSAYWFDKAQVAEAATIPGAIMNKDVAAKALKENPNLNVLIPPKGVVARTLIDDWLDDA
jgi:NAD+ diphosphatase